MFADTFVRCREVENNFGTLHCKIRTGRHGSPQAMTATIEEIPYALLHHITNRITSEVEGINRVLLDLTPKPIGTIEWE